MIVCVCMGITDRDIRGQVRNGARSVEDVVVGCGAATDCASCHRDVARIVSETLAESESGSPAISLPLAPSPV